MSNAPERLWAWHWHKQWDANPPASGPDAIGQAGYCRPNDRYPLDKRERESGADYTRTDLIAAMIEKAVQPARDDIIKELEVKLAECEARLRKAVEALDEAVYLLAPTKKDMERQAGVYRIVTTLEELKGESHE